MKAYVLALALLMLGYTSSSAAAQETPPPSDASAPRGGDSNSVAPESELSPPAAGPPKDWIQLPALALPPGPPPKLTIVSPAMEAEVIGKPTRTPEDRFSNFDCLLDSKKFGIKVAAENWPVRAGGPGVLIVVDGVYATVTHDLSKPVLLADLEPYEYDSFASNLPLQFPMFVCTSHWIAAVPTDSTGRMLPVAPVVSWWHNVHEGQHVDESPEAREGRLTLGLPVVNWPLVGPLYLGTGWDGSSTQDRTHYRSGHLLNTPKRVVFDWTVAQQPSERPCAFGVATQDEGQDWETRTELGLRGTVVLPASFTNQVLVLDGMKCGRVNYFSGLWSKRPASPPKPYSWPVPGSATADNYFGSSQGRALIRRGTQSRPSGEACVLDRDCDSGVCVHIRNSKKVSRCQ